MSYVWYEIASDGEAIILEIQEVLSTSLLSLLPDPFGVVVAVIVLFMDQIYPFAYYLYEIRIQILAYLLGLKGQIRPLIVILFNEKRDNPFTKCELGPLIYQAPIYIKIWYLERILFPQM